jgi:TRAP-type C4-dicarboxylate transport system permease small subunit
MELVRFVDKIITKLSSILLVVLCTVMILSACLQVLARTIIKLPLAWTEELCRYAMICLVLVAAGIGVKEDKHISVTIVRDMFPEKTAKIIYKFMNILIIIFSIVLVYYGYNFAVENFRQLTPGLKIPMGAVDLCLPVGGVVMCFYAILNVSGLRKKI